MSKIYLKEIVHLLLSLLFGIVAFLISGILASIVTSGLDIPFSYLFVIIFGGLGGLLLALFLRMRQKVGRMALAGVAAWPAGFLGGIALVDFVLGLLTSFYDFYPGPGYGDGFCDILAGFIFGAVFGAIVFGRKSILLFSVVCGVVSITLGLLNEALQPWGWYRMLAGTFLEHIGINMYTLMVSLSCGIGAGLSIGLYKMLTKRNDEEQQIE